MVTTGSAGPAFQTFTVGQNLDVPVRDPCETTGSAVTCAIACETPEVRLDLGAGGGDGGEGFVGIPVTSYCPEE